MNNFNIKIPISNSLLKNKSLNSTSFLLYSYLQMKKSLSLYKDYTIVYGVELKEIINVLTNSTFKKYMLELKNFNLIQFQQTTFNNSTRYEILLNDIVDGFTLINSSLFSEISRIDSIGFRLLCYYKYMSFKGDYAYPSYLQIENDLGFDNSTINKYNKLLVDNELLEIKQSKFKKDDYSPYAYKTNNSYYVKM